MRVSLKCREQYKLVDENPVCDKKHTQKLGETDTVIVVVVIVARSAHYLTQCEPVKQQWQNIKFNDGYIIFISPDTKLIIVSPCFSFIICSGCGCECVRVCVCVSVCVYVFEKPLWLRTIYKCFSLLCIYFDATFSSQFVILVFLPADVGSDVSQFACHEVRPSSCSCSRATIA